MSEFNINDFTDLQGTGVEGRVQVKPEDEFFHSVYIAGKTRKNHIDVTEQAGLLQVRGVEYNKSEVDMIITHTKEILVKNETRNKKESLACFSFKEGPPPWYGTSKLPDSSPRPCPLNSEQRALNDFCNPCRSQILIGGIYCNPDGTPILKEDEEGVKKPIFVFIRGKGTKYNNVSVYLNDCFKLEYSPLFTPVSTESTKFEKSVVNNKRHTTKIGLGTASSRYGDKDVFTLEKGIELEPKVVYSILQVTKKTLEKFNEKFDWSKGVGAAATTYAPEQQAKEEGVMTFDDQPADENTTDAAQEEPKQSPPPSQDAFSFDDVNF